MRDHIERKIREAEIQFSPFPHLVIRDFFPQEVFDKIVEYNPFHANKGVEWLSKKHSEEISSNTPYYARKQINFHMNQKFEAPPEQRDFWNALKATFLIDDWFPKLILEKYPEYFKVRFGDLTQDTDFFSLMRRELFLQRHEPGYYIGPHTDIPTRIFTCIFSFATQPGFEQFGTELLAPKSRLDRCWGNDHYPPDAFDVKTVAPYSPNNFLLFFKTRQSFHSVRAIDDTVPNQRYGMQFQFYEPHGGLFNDLSAPEIMHVKRLNAPALRKSLPRRLIEAIRG
ncbi:hypothetical protein [Caulobacter segnis]